MPDDPLLLGQRVVAILEQGQRDATYKLATLMALIEHSIENLPPHPDDSLTVPIPELAHRVLSLYWHQARPFQGHHLAQRRTGTKTRIIDAAKVLREASNAGTSRMSLETAMLRAPAAYEVAIDRIALALIKQPLPRLQKLPGAPVSDPFLYDDSFLGENVSRSRVRAHGDAITLNPGVAHALARLAGLLKPALEIMWVEDVRSMNKFLDEDVPDVAGHLFGRERTALMAVRGPFKEAFGPHCFYCGTHLPLNNPIDHVLPWSLVGIDGLANLVLACARCNGDKSGALPALSIVDRVLSRESDALEQIAQELQWPTQHERVVAAARGIYRGQPEGVPTWAGYKQSERLDISFPPRWITPK
ncbi:HNH endonuclease [Mycobacterium sp. E136]|uniref:HNH endonuclease n=1 Tax=Mycobacterium sp. E136 TaxID=1834125 RepID=UPI0007FFC70C|nr:HNH endonuclease [Mycobacterium sp. E136]OBH00924.1 HNH endonuclease [Mycobacterium sp. E136]